MPAYLAHEDVVAVKWVAGYPGAKARGLPYISGLVVLNDAETGVPVAVMDGAEITAARTAAASGVCIRRWAAEGWQTAAIVGCGEQGRFHARLLRALNPAVRIRAYDRHPERVEALEADVEPARSEVDAVAEADVIVTTTPLVSNPDPPIGADTLGARWLVLPVDFDALVRRDLVEAADLFAVDDVAQFEYYRGQGHFRDWPESAGSVGEALERGDAPARVACVNLGIGALDAAFAARVFAAARERGAGTVLPR